MKIENVNVSELKAYAKNAKMHPDEQVQKIASSIEQFGFRQPIVIDKNNVIVMGHGRLLAAKKLGLTEVPCYTSGDFVTQTDIKEPCLFDMELALILAMGFTNVTAIKTVSDNLNKKEYEQCLKK